MRECEEPSCSSKAVIKRGKDGRVVCAQCFIQRFEQDVHETIVKEELFKRGDRVAIGASGGKDSTVLAYVIKTLNERYDYGLEILLLSIDEGIKGYRDDSLEAVEKNRIEYGLPLKILSYEELYGWTMDKVVGQIGKKNNCTYCGVFRRKALDRGAELIGANKLVTGHNADDMAETVLMNILRGDTARLGRCTKAMTGEESELPRVKPLKLCFEKDIVFYARLQKLEYFYTECIYAPNSYRNFARNYIKQLERLQPRAILDLIHSGETVEIKDEVYQPTQIFCKNCGYISSQPLCKACLLLEGLNTGNLDLGHRRVKPHRLANENRTNSLTVTDKASGGCGGQCACESSGINGLSI